MDEKDLRILVAIARLGTGSTERLSAETGIPKSTVHYRLGNLRDEGIVTNDLLDVDLSRVGLNVTVITEVTAEYEEGCRDELGRKLEAVEGANQVYVTMGDTDFVVVSHLADRDMVGRLIEQYEAIDEVAHTSSKFVIETVKDERRPLNDFETDTLRRGLNVDGGAGDP